MLGQLLGYEQRSPCSVQARSCAARSFAGQVDVAGVPGQANVSPAATGLPWPSEHWNAPLVQTQKSATVDTPHVYSGPQVNPGAAHATPMVSSGVVGQTACAGGRAAGVLELEEHATMAAHAAAAAAADPVPHRAARPGALTMRRSAGYAA
jgi:hypothetical protein